MGDVDEVTALIARTLVVANREGETLTEQQIQGYMLDWSHEATAVRDALTEAGLLLDPGAGGTSEHPDLVRQVLNGDEVRKAVYSLAAAVVDARCERWREQGRNEERLKLMKEKSNG